MQVTVGAEWPTSSAGRRSYAVTLDEDDLRTMLPEDAELPASAVARLDMMSKRAEILVLRYVHKQGGIGDEAFRARTEAIRNS
jgi:hypothetical protein